MLELFREHGFDYTQYEQYMDLPVKMNESKSNGNNRNYQLGKKQKVIISIKDIENNLETFIQKFKERNHKAELNKLSVLQFIMAITQQEIDQMRSFSNRKSKLKFNR